MIDPSDMTAAEREQDAALISYIHTLPTTIRETLNAQVRKFPATQARYDADKALCRCIDVLNGFTAEHPIPPVE